MLNRPTVLIFTDGDKANTASALKEQMLEARPDAVVIIIDESELYADTLKDFVEKVFGIPANIPKRLAKFRAAMIDRHIDDVGVSENAMKSKESYKKMVNIVNRYSPVLVVSVGFGAFREAVAARDSGKTERFSVAAYIADYALNKQLVNKYIDNYVVVDMAVKTSLANAGIPEDNVIPAGFAIAKRFTDGMTKEAALKILKLPDDKPVLAFIALNGDDFGAFDGVDLGSVTALCYCGEDREAYRKAIDYGFYAYNEGVSPALIYAASDAVAAPPEAYFTAAAFETGKILALTPPGDNQEKINFKVIAPFAEQATDPGKTAEFLKKLAAGELTALRPSVYPESAGKALLDTVYPKKI